MSAKTFKNLIGLTNVIFFSFSCWAFGASKLHWVGLLGTVLFITVTATIANYGNNSVKAVTGGVLFTVYFMWGFIFYSDSDGLCRIIESLHWVSPAWAGALYIYLVCTSSLLIVRSTCKSLKEAANE